MHNFQVFSCHRAALCMPPNVVACSLEQSICLLGHMIHPYIFVTGFWYPSVNYTYSVIIYDHRVFIKSATGWLNDTQCWVSLSSLSLSWLLWHQACTLHGNMHSVTSAGYLTPDQGNLTEGEGSVQLISLCWWTAKRPRTYSLPQG
jgi:hypothetical protein